MPRIGNGVRQGLAADRSDVGDVLGDILASVQGLFRRGARSRAFVWPFVWRGEPMFELASRVRAFSPVGEFDAVVLAHFLPCHGQKALHGVVG